jgi:hypothetical protein
LSRLHIAEHFSTEVVMPTVEVALAVAEAALGAVEVAKGVYQDTPGGFRIKADGASYPKELRDFLRSGTLVNREVMKFVSDGYIWDTELGVSMRGSFSNNNSDLVCFDDNPGIPSNRFMTNVQFFESPHSDTVSKSLLDIAITAYDQPYGNPDNPHLAFSVVGHFDPVGVGDERFAFNLYVDSYGQVSAGEIDSSSGLEITTEDGYVQIFLNQ